MKKIILFSLIVLFCTTSKAQFISGLDEVAILGQWSAIGYAENADNIWPSMQNKRMVGIKFSDDGITTITVQDSNFGSSNLIHFYGYIIGGTSTGKYTLHFIQQAPSETWGYSTPQLNFVIKSYDDEKMTLMSYDGKHGIILQKVNSGMDNITSDASDAPKASTIYNINGVKIENPITPGVYIRGNGEKFIQK